MKRQIKTTSYFIFSCEDPLPADFKKLFEVADGVDAFIAYTVSRVSTVNILKGFLYLRGPRTTPENLMELLPRFTFKKSDDCSYHGLRARGEHPFDTVKVKLFHEDVNE